MELAEQEPVFVPPNPEEKSIEKFRREINHKRGITLGDYRDLHAYSVHPDTIENFWQDVWDYVDIKASQLSKTVSYDFG